jgi:hypothetical protein
MAILRRPAVVLVAGATLAATIGLSPGGPAQKITSP